MGSYWPGAAFTRGGSNTNTARSMYTRFATVNSLRAGSIRVVKPRSMRHGDRVLNQRGNRLRNRDASADCVACFTLFEWLRWMIEMGTLSSFGFTFCIIRRKKLFSALECSKKASPFAGSIAQHLWVGEHSKKQKGESGTCFMR